MMKRAITTVAALAVFFTLSAMAADPGLVLHYGFEEGQGDIAKDLSGNGNNGKLHKARWVKGAFGSALEFNGIDSFVDCGSNPTLDTTTTGSLSVWFYPTHDLGGGLVVRVTGNDWPDERLVLTHYQKSRLLWAIADGKRYITTANIDVPLNAWTHVVMSFDGRRVALYVNGKLSHVQAQAYNPDVKGVPLVIGKSSGLGHDYFKGMIDDVRIYNRALSDAEVQSLFAQDSNGRDGRIERSMDLNKGLSVHYTFDEGDGNVAKDVSGNHNDGLIKEASWTKSPKGNALKFDGTSGRVGIEKAPAFDRSGDGTLTAWVKLAAPLYPDRNTNWTIFDNEVYIHRSGSILRIDGGSSKLFYRGTNAIVSNKTLDNNTFYHVAAVRRGNNISLFLDGIRDTTAESALPGPPEKPFTISADSQAFNGILDEVRIYDRALSNAEVMAIYRQDAAIMGKDTSQLGMLKVVPFLYFDRGTATANVDFTGIQPIEEGYHVSLTLQEAQKGVIQTWAVKDIPEAGQADYALPVATLLPGNYEFQAILRDPQGEVKAEDGFAFQYPPAPPKVVSPAEKALPPLPPPASPAPYSVEVTKGGGFLLTLGAETYPVESSFSYPGGGYYGLAAANTPDSSWQVRTNRIDAKTYQVEADGKSYLIKRLVELYPNRISVKDTITNKSDEPVGILLKNTIGCQGFAEGYLGGRKVSASVQEGQVICSNPTVFLARKGLGIGLVALDDVFIFQLKGNFETGGKASISSDTFALDKGASYTLEWAIYPNASGEYYDFINEVRRDEKRNGCIDGGLTGVWDRSAVRWLVPASRDYFDMRGAKYGFILCLDKIADDPGLSIEGIEFLEYPKERQQLKQQMQAIHKIAPDVKLMFHVAHALYATNKPDEIFPDSRVIGSDGKQAFVEGGGYFSKERREQGWRGWYVYYPTLDNSFGKALLKSVDVMVDEMGCQGAFMDGFYSSMGGAYTYDRWDGHSAEIDPATKTITRKMGSVILLYQDVMVAFVRKMRSKGAVVVANHPYVITRTIANESGIIYNREIEAGPENHLAPTLASLSNPEVVMKGELEIYHDIQDKLKWGNLFFHYDDGSVKLTHKPISAYMYPLTFEEIHSGYVKGKERLVTSHSGLYGWRDDDSLHFAYPADARGVVGPNRFLTTVDASGVRTYVDLKEDEMAVLRKIPVTLKTESAVNVITQQYDADHIAFTLNGVGKVDVEVRNGDFPISANSTYLVNDKPVRSIAEAVLTFPLTLSGEAVVKIVNK